MIRNLTTNLLLLLLLSLLFAAKANAQTGNISGTIKDTNNQPLTGATVLVLGTQIGATTDIDGGFKLTDVPVGKFTLRISYIGFENLKKSGRLSPNQTLDLGIITLEADVEQLQEVEVREQLEEGGEMTARLKMLRSDRIANVIGKESIARLPDKNVGEAFARLAGVVLETDQGEGKYISFRGTPVDWSSTLVNGDRMPIANEEMVGRSLNFDVLPTSLVAYLENTISLTPDVEGDAIGGVANMVTKDTPTDSTMLEVQSGIGYNAKSGKPVWNGSITYGDRFFNKRLGVLVGGSIFSRNWATDNFEIFYGNNDNHSLQRLELRRYDGLKTSYGANFKVDYRFSNRHLIYASGFLGITDDNEFNRKTQFNWVAGVGQSIRLQNIHNILHNQLTGMEIGGHHEFGKLQMDWKAAQYENQFSYGDVPFDNGDPRNGYFVIEFEKVVRYNDYLNLDEEGNITDPFNAFTRLKLLDIDSPVEDYGDHYERILPSYDEIVAVKPSDTMFVFNKAYTETNEHTERDPLVARLDFTYDYSSNVKYKVGFKYRTKEGKRQLGLEGWVRNPLAPGVIVNEEFDPQFYNNDNDFLSEIGAPYAGMLFPFLTDSQIDNFIPQLEAEDRITFIPFGTKTPFYKEFIGSSFRYSEDVLAAYVSGSWKISDQLSLNGGLRLEETIVRVEADSVIENIAENTRSLSSVVLNRRYTALLPMLNVRYQFQRQSMLRLSVSRSFRRPNFNELKPGEPEIHYTHFHVLYGNPQLRPTYSWNTDLSYQHFFGLKGMVMLSLYYKRVIDHIFTSFEAQSLDISSESNQFLVPGGLASKRYQNAPYANLLGAELTVSRKLDFISPALRQFELTANYTYTYSRMKIQARDELQPLPRQAPSLFNVRLSYNSRRFSANVGLNYRDPYLEELNLFALKDPVTGEPTIIQQDTQYDIYQGQNLSMDASFSYQITPRFSILAEANNLLNTPFVVYRGQRERPVQTEYYGIRGQVSLRYTLTPAYQQRKGNERLGGGHHGHNH
ncbi:MAG: TonB-dependent receptor [Saprospiraceae bacterium]|nr:TonB-dependent receptor [Saprospiraceae bacterium]